MSEISPYMSKTLLSKNLLLLYFNNLLNFLWMNSRKKTNLVSLLTVLFLSNQFVNSMRYYVDFLFFTNFLTFFLNLNLCI